MNTIIPAPVALADGLVLRQAGPADLDQIGALLADRGDPSTPWTTGWSSPVPVTTAPSGPAARWSSTATGWSPQ
ncbi:hypothetical protein GXW82_03670 [Streptacidiphilus sp. 4-A2]|nr:hypothetical protein [Streptacidiphilus sp. 4-A2]